jgi:Eukaryotic membrane protein family
MTYKSPVKYQEESHACQGILLNLKANLQKLQMKICTPYLVSSLSENITLIRVPGNVCSCLSPCLSNVKLLAWLCAFENISIDMIEGPFSQLEPNHDPFGGDHHYQSQPPRSITKRAPNQDGVLRVDMAEESKEEFVNESDSLQIASKGYGDERTEGQANTPQATSMHFGQGETALHKQDEPQRSRIQTIGGEDVLSQPVPAQDSGATQEDVSIGWIPDLGHEKQPDNHKRRRSQVDSTVQTHQKEKVLKLTPEKIHELTSSPQSLPRRVLASTDVRSRPPTLPPPSFSVSLESRSGEGTAGNVADGDVEGAANIENAAVTTIDSGAPDVSGNCAPEKGRLLPVTRPTYSIRASSSPSSVSRMRALDIQPVSAGRRSSKPTPTPLRFEDGRLAGARSSFTEDRMPSPMPKTIPLPPMSLPTYLQLELSSHRPSPLYIHRSVTSDFPYESSRVKIERLLNFLLLPPELEQVLWFGALACLDAWLYTFTILPLRLLKSFYILGQSWATNIVTEIQYVSSFIYAGTGRMWKRRRTRGNSASKATPDGQGPVCLKKNEGLASANGNGSIRGPNEKRRLSLSKRNATDESGKKVRRHRRIKSVPSALLPDDKADILKGLLIICTCLILMRLDASRMYHWIRGQAALKLYVIYNLLEVGDRLLSAIGQDVLECLFSREALERGRDGHSKVLRPFWLFLLALCYTVVHATALFYQVITLNVAVNSYSNALITLLMSNQFVEIKSTVFKKFEKENLFQLTCADVVERFQLWLMLLIIASRNIVETGGLSAGLSIFGSSASFFSPTATNSSSAPNQPPRSAASILPKAFTLLPDILSSLTTYAPSIGHVLGPFLVVLGSEMLVDWLKHSYINKFNNTRPAIYGRFLDVLAKDYYSNAFAEQNLTKRLGLPVIPLSCLFIRASVQTYHMFLAAWIPPTLSSSATGLTSVHNHYTSSSASMPTSTAAALSKRFDDLLRQIPASITSSRAFSNFGTILVFLLIFLVLLILKLVLGMLLLAFARSRYRSMKEREKNPIHHVEGGRRVGGWGVVEVDDDKRRWIYEDDAEGARQLREREERETARREKGTGEGAFEKVKRYEMVAKRIW